MSHFDEGRKYKTSLLKRFEKAGAVLLFIEAPTLRISVANPLCAHRGQEIQNQPAEAFRESGRGFAVH